MHGLTPPGPCPCPDIHVHNVLCKAQHRRSKCSYRIRPLCPKRELAQEASWRPRFSCLRRGTCHRYFGARPANTRPWQGQEAFTQSLWITREGRTAIAVTLPPRSVVWVMQRANEKVLAARRAAGTREVGQHASWQPVEPDHYRYLQHPRMTTPSSYDACANLDLPLSLLPNLKNRKAVLIDQRAPIPCRWEHRTYGTVSLPVR